jgi:hypothetical protein
MNIVNSSYRNILYKEDSAACIALQTTKYMQKFKNMKRETKYLSDIYYTSYLEQQQKAH